MALAKKRHIVTTSHRPIKEVHIIGEREIIFLIYNNIIILLYINHNIRSILRIATSLMGQWDNGTTGQKAKAPQSPPFRPPREPPYCPRGGFITNKAIVSPSGDEGGALGGFWSCLPRRWRAALFF